ncbi:hypothetical protein K469DRAFT_716290 [Zopfia rhizophila CBS 207.26]|uniref:Uncharacterized protein n=1 Tax=Zopfia rhizophila CBS 207.26 TaxID=1314779 RepID=A0A6A6DK38_9PEZI|nr:hypothetical protein K469DRAFT_716290 [Zopfia rhizophila CBS 207.26]
MSARITTVVAYPSKHPGTGEPIKFNMSYCLSGHTPIIDRAWGPHGMKSWSIN